MKYPVETLTEGSSLCAHLSALAASLLKAEGLDVVLIIYYNPDPKQAGHTNVGIHLRNPPFEGAQSFTQDGKEYYIAETTNHLFAENNSFSWLNSWKVGQMPDMIESWDHRIAGL